MEILRTPDARFAGLVGYPFAPNYHFLGAATLNDRDLRMHYVDVGAKNARHTVLMLHGEPTWSFLYRHMIPMFAEAGYRAIAPDFIGFGRSDKPLDQQEYSYQKHEDWLWDLIKALKLQNIILVCQDWGGLLGLRLVARYPERFAAVVAANTFLPTGSEPPNEAFLRWKETAQSTEELDVGAIVNSGCTSTLSAAARAGYNAPFPDASYKTGPKVFPTLVPTEASNLDGRVNRDLWTQLADFDKPFLTAFSDGDPITRGADLTLQKAIAGCKDAQHCTIAGAGHFVQEERGPELGKIVLQLARTLG